MTYAVGPGQTVETYQYDYAGELLSKTSAQGNTTYSYGTGVAPLAEKSSFGPSQQKDFIQINGRTVGEFSRTEGGQWWLQKSS